MAANPKELEDFKFAQVGTRPLRPDGVDKVTGRARYGADVSAPGMLIGRVLRSPHAHARILNIDTSAAEALDGVKAVVTRDDFPELAKGVAVEGEGEQLVYDVSCNVMAREKALYEGHAVAAVAATNANIARKALSLINVEYEVLQHVTDVDEAMKADAPVLHDTLFTRGLDKAPDKPSNIAERTEIKIGDVSDGFSAADVIVERQFKTEAAHQGYIEPHACLASVSEDGQVEMWCCTQGHYIVRDFCAGVLDMELSKIKVTASEIGGGFGGKTTVFVEPVAVALSKKAHRPVKVVMSRDEVFRASGPTSSASMHMKIGVTKDGIITAGEGEFRMQGGAFPGSPVPYGAACAFAPYVTPNVHLVSYDVVTNRPKQAAYRAPGAPMCSYAVESVLDELAEKIGMDPIELRLKNAVEEGDQSAYGPTFGPIGMVETLEAARDHQNYAADLHPNQGRGVATGFWPNYGGATSVTLNVNSDGTVLLSLGCPDIGGSRASMCLIAAEELGISYQNIKAIIADTSSLAYNNATGGSRVTHSAGMATIQAAQHAIDSMRERAAQIWGIEVDAVIWESGAAKPAGSNAGDFDPMSFADIAAVAANTGGPISGHAEITAEGAGNSFGTHVVDVEVDPDTGAVTVLRYLVVQDAGKAVHPSYVEGQYQGGAVQGIGWALNEEYIYGDDGKLQNAGFLDYRMPVTSDMPMIDTVIVEIPNPGHPYGVRGVGETPIVPPLAAVGNAVARATGKRFEELPMSPPKILDALN